MFVFILDLSLVEIEIHLNRTRAIKFQSGHL